MQKILETRSFKIFFSFLAPFFCLSFFASIVNAENVNAENVNAENVNAENVNAENVNAENSAPSIEWQKSFGGSDYDYASSIQITLEGGYIIAGRSSSNDGDVTENHGKFDYWIVNLDAQGTLKWQKSFGGSGFDSVHSIQITSDGGYIIAGRKEFTESDIPLNHGKGDYWIIKLDSQGNLLWQKFLGGSDYDEANCIQITSDGGYIIAGYSSSSDGDVKVNRGGYDYWIVKLDSQGNLQWAKSFGGSKNEVPFSCQQTSDGDYIIAGYSYSNDGDVVENHGKGDFWIVKLDSQGTIKWQKSLGGSELDEATSIQITLDGGFIVAGSTYSIDGDVTENHGGSDIWIVKLDSEGTLQWQKSFGGSGNESTRSIHQISDGGYIFVGSSKSNDGDVTGNHGDEDYWLVKLNSQGTLLWQNSLGGSKKDVPFSTQQTSDGGYIIAGYSFSTDGDVTGNHGHSDYWIVKLQR
ncbi:MAG: hypothetical protein LBD41_02235 [Clostridiales Family XIII bacterium]|jgi:hypothetical protein|nr:hypothetical protein [Clostridiales Family XIII bacterium]